MIFNKTLSKKTTVPDMSHQYFNQPLEGEVTLKEIIEFLLDSWKVIACLVLCGLLVSIVYLTITPNQYEATAQIQMSQISVNSNSNSLGVNIEDPNLLIARLKLPSTYSAVEIKACGLDQMKSPAETLVNMLKVASVNGVSSTVELRVRMKSKEQSLQCAQAIFENIRESQNKIIKPYIEEANALLLKHQNRLREIRALISSIEKSRETFPALDLLQGDEVRFLNNEIARLNSFIVAGGLRQAKLVSPIYVSEEPVFPKKKTTLILGLLIGLFLGIFLMIVTKLWNNFKVNKP